MAGAGGRAGRGERYGSAVVLLTGTGAGGRAGREEWYSSAVVLLTGIHETDWISELLLPKAESFSLVAKVNLSATGISARLSAPLYYLSF